MSDIKSSNLITLIEIFDQMSNDLQIGRLSNYEKDVLLNLHRESSNNGNKEIEVNIKKIRFLDFNGNLISKSTLYKSLKSLCDKKLVVHLGTERSSIYKLN